MIPLTVEDIQNEEVVRHLKYLQFNPSSKMNGCFIALLTRDVSLFEIFDKYQKLSFVALVSFSYNYYRKCT